MPLTGPTTAIPNLSSASGIGTGAVAFWSTPTGLASDTVFTFNSSNNQLVVGGATGQGSGSVQIAGDLITAGPHPGVDVRTFGATWGPSGFDNSQAIQAAINSLSNSGGTVYLPAPSGPGFSMYGIATTLLINSSSIKIKGDSSFATADVGGQAQERGTFLWWQGGSGVPMMKVSPTTPVVGTSQALKRVEVSDLTFECAGSAAIGLQILSAQSSDFHHLYFRNPYQVALDVGVVASGTALGEAKDTTKTTFRNISIRAIDGVSGAGMRLDGDGIGNVSLCMFEDISVVHGNGKGILHNNSDTNKFTNVFMNRAAGTSGIGWDVTGSNINGLQSRANLFDQISVGPGGMYLRGSGLAWPTRDNICILYSQENGEPLPVIEGSATFYWRGSTGVNSSMLGNSPAFRVPTSAILNAAGGTNATGIPNLSFPIAGSDSWNFSARLLVQNPGSASGGLKFGIQVPSGFQVQAGVMGIGSGPTNVVSSYLNNSGSLTPQIYAGASGAIGPVSIEGTVYGATPWAAGGGGFGSVQISFASLLGLTGTILPGSALVAQKVGP